MLPSQPAQGNGPAIYINSAGALELKNSILTNYNPGIYLAGTLNENYNMSITIRRYCMSLAMCTILVGTLPPRVGPQFISPARGDYHLLARLPSIRGANMGVVVDREGLPRTNRWDVGAYQFHWRQNNNPEIE